MARVLGSEDLCIVRANISSHQKDAILDLDESTNFLKFD